MSESTPSQEPESTPYNASQPPTLGPRSPEKMFWFSGLSACLIVTAFLFNSAIEDFTGQGIDVVMVMSVFYTGAVIAIWTLWVLILSRWAWSWRIITASLLIALPFVFLKVFRPVNGGDATIVGFEPFWAERPEVEPAFSHFSGFFRLTCVISIRRK